MSRNTPINTSILIFSVVDRNKYTPIELTGEDKVNAQRCFSISFNSSPLNHMYVENPIAPGM